LSLNTQEIAEFDMVSPSASSKDPQIESSRNYGELEEADDVSTFQDSQEKPSEVEGDQMERSLHLSSLDEEDKIFENHQQLKHLSGVEAQVMDFGLLCRTPTH
jgi:hypothetical protein